MKENKYISSSKGNKPFGWPQCGLVCIVFELLQEFLLFRFGWSLWEVLPKAFSAVVAVLGVIASGTLPYFFDTKKISFNRNPEDAFWPHFIRLIKKIYKRYLRYNTLLHGVLIITFIICGPAYAANHHWAEKCIKWVFTPNQMNIVSDSEDKKTENLDPPDSNKDSAENPTPAPEEDMITDQRPLAERLILGPDIEHYLSEEDYNAVFFLDGEHHIVNWDETEHIYSQVEHFVQDFRGFNFDPNYEEVGTPQSVKDDIAHASTLEEKMLTSEELDTVIALRLDAYSNYPEYRLTKLLRENFCLFGDAYRVQRVSNNAAVFYYGKSILWGMEALKYSVEGDSLAKNLEILSERYMKIKMVLPINSAGKLYADKLAEIFQALANAN